MRVGSVFSGIGGFDLGFENAGMTCVWQCEIDKDASKVLKNHWPNVPNIGDVRYVTRNTVEPIDVLCGGFPCQDLSIAGKREGLAGKRSGLWFEFERIIGELSPRTVIIENVPGLLSSHQGRDFATILSGLVKFGYGVCWRVLDAQFFGVPQRRRRVFVVGSLGDGRAAEVLFECESLSGNPPTRREAGQETTGIAGTLSANGGGLDRPAGNANELDFCVPTMALNSRNNRLDAESQTFIAFDGRNMDTHEQSPTLQSKKQGYSLNFTPMAFTTEQTPKYSSNQAFTLTKQSPTGGGHQMSVAGSFGVRRLTPTECERLQGFPDGWTDGQSDTVRYRQLGNAVAVPVAEWIGRRIMESI